MSLGESVTVHFKAPYPWLAFLHLPWLSSPAGLGNRASAPLECAAFRLRGPATSIRMLGMTSAVP